MNTTSPSDSPVEAEADFTKGPGFDQIDLNSLSSDLREIRDQIQSGEAENALMQVEALLLEQPMTTAQQGKVLALAADSEFQRGAYEEAAEIQEHAASLVEDDPLLWLRPRMGKIRALLKAAQIEAAWEQARVILTDARQKWSDFHSGARQIRHELRKGKVVPFSPRPQRLSVIASELGRLFLREGEIDAAKEFLQAALDACPKGATRARESLAEIALREDNPEAALQWVMQALMMGRLQAKTLHSLRLLVQIKHALGEPTIGAEVLAMVATALPSIRARATLVLVQELRSIGSPQWKTLADHWLRSQGSKFPVEAAELRKIFLRESKQKAADPATNISAALAVLRQPDISPMEWLSAAKEYVRSSWFAGSDPGLDSLVQGAEGAYGIEFAHGAAHSLALSTMMAKRHDIAIPWLEARLTSMPAGSETWGKSLWALGRIEAYFERHQRAAHFYNLFASSEAMPLNLRAQARLKWVQALVAAGDTTAIATGIAEVRALLPVVDDWSTLLDIARQLRFAPGDEADKLAFQFWEKAEKEAVAAINTTLLPAEAHTILLKLARRTTQDFHKPERTVAIWDSISAEMKLWLWSESTVYWEYLSFVLLSLLEANKEPEADQLHASLAAGASTPKIGKLFFLITYGDWLMKQNKNDQSGLAMLSQALDLDPGHTLSRKAHYWWAQHYWDAGDPVTAKKHAIQVRYEPWAGSGMLEDWQMAARCEWILADGDESKLDPKMVAKFGRKLFALKKEQPAP